jgi:hypothetical protein
MHTLLLLTRGWFVLYAAVSRVWKREPLVSARVGVRRQCVTRRRRRLVAIATLFEGIGQEAHVLLFDSLQRKGVTDESDLHVRRACVR